VLRHGTLVAWDAIQQPMYQQLLTKFVLPTATQTTARKRKIILNNNTKTSRAQIEESKTSFPLLLFKTFTQYP